MFVSRTLTLVSVTFAILGVTPSFALPSTAHSSHLQKRGQCAATLTVAESAANHLQSSYYNSFLGNYKSGELWTDCARKPGRIRSGRTFDMDIRSIGRSPDQKEQWHT